MRMILRSDEGENWKWEMVKEDACLPCDRGAPSRTGRRSLASGRSRQTSSSCLRISSFSEGETWSRPNPVQWRLTCISPPLACTLDSCKLGGWAQEPASGWSGIGIPGLVRLAFGSTSQACSSQRTWLDHLCLWRQRPFGQSRCSHRRWSRRERLLYRSCQSRLGGCRSGGGTGRILAKSWFSKDPYQFLLQPCGDPSLFLALLSALSWVSSQVQFEHRLSRSHIGIFSILPSSATHLNLNGFKSESSTNCQTMKYVLFATHKTSSECGVSTEKTNAELKSLTTSKPSFN